MTQVRPEGCARALVLLVGAVCLLVLSIRTPAQGWPVPQAVGRIRVERVKKTSWPAAVGFAQIWPAGRDPTRCQVAVFTGGGRPAGSQIIWAADGEPLKILFDTSSGEVTYDVFLSEAPVQTPAWQAEAGILLETRHYKPGPVDTWEKAWRLFQSSEPVLGRSIMPDIFLGVHPHGPTAQFAGRYLGWFSTKTNGPYEFAVVSTGTAYLRIDGKPVAQRVGVAGSRGRRGEYNGKVDLSPGRHQIEYLFFHAGAGEWVAEAAWKPPGGKDYFYLLPKEACLPIARFNTFSWLPPAGRNDAAAFEWETTGQNMVGDMALVSVQFRTVGGRKETGCRWKFDDGTTASGSPVTHVFTQTGLRRVQFSLDDKATPTATLVERVKVQPDWSQPQEWRETLFEEQKKQLLARDYSVAPTDDLAALVALADAISETELRSRAGAACLQRLGEFKAYQAGLFVMLGNHFEQPRGRDYPAAEKAFRGALALAAEDSAMKQRAKLGLAHLLTDVLNRPAEALELLKNLRQEVLTSESIRQGRLFTGDALAAQGKLDEATKTYRAGGDLVSPTNLLRSVRSAARLESARDLIRRAEYDDAEEILRQIEWENPMERLSAETGLPMILIHLGRKDYLRALARCQRLLYSATVDTHRADVLLYLAESESALGREDAARETLARLFKENPYSEAAARAKDRWGAAAGTGRK